MFAGIHVRHLTAPETQRNLHPVTLTDKLSGSIDLCVQIVCINVGGKTNLLNFHNLLFFLCFLVFSGLLILELAVIHNLTNRRLGRRRNLNQIHPRFLRKFHRFSGRHNAKLFSVCTDHPYFSVSDLLINK